jgi:hypothetical protein
MFTALYAMRGYLPEMEPQEFETREEAEEFLIAELKLHHDQETQHFDEIQYLDAHQIQQLKNAENACADAIAGIYENSIGAYGNYIYQILRHGEFVNGNRVKKD